MREKAIRCLPHQRFWLTLLGLGDYKVHYRRVNHRGVFNVETRRLNNSFVGARMDHKRKIVWLFTSRKLKEADLLHEFICHLHQNLPHEEIDPLCEKLVAARLEGKAEELIAENRLGLGFIQTEMEQAVAAG